MTGILPDGTFTHVASYPVATVTIACLCFCWIASAPPIVPPRVPNSRSRIFLSRLSRTWWVAHGLLCLQVVLSGILILHAILGAETMIEGVLSSRFRAVAATGIGAVATAALLGLWRDRICNLLTTNPARRRAFIAMPALVAAGAAAMISLTIAAV